jgi:hypothetical protein
MNKKQQDPTEPFYYIALVLKGTEQQYVNLLKYLKNRNGAQVIYQCKSLTYLHVAKDEGIKTTAVACPQLQVAVEA